VLPETFGLFDFVNMWHDEGRKPASGILGYSGYLVRGAACRRKIFGLPFYARPDGTPYWKIIQADPQAANLDFFDYYGVTLNYNGIPTIQQKTNWPWARWGDDLGDGS
jgi:hypothetical protein